VYLQWFVIFIQCVPKAALPRRKLDAALLRNAIHIKTSLNLLKHVSVCFFVIYMQPVVCTTTLKSYGCKSMLLHIIVYEFEISSVTTCRSGSDGVMQFTAPPRRKPMDLVNQRAIIEAEFEKVNEDKSLCVTILSSVPERCRRLSNNRDISNNYFSTVLLK